MAEEAKEAEEAATAEGEEPTEVTADADEDSAGSKIVTALIVIVIVAIWLAIFAVLIKLDVGNFGSGILYPVLKDVPVVNKILPEPKDRKDDEGYINNLQEANARIQQLERQLASTDSSGTANEDEIEKLKKENARLKKFEDEQQAFVRRVNEYDENVIYSSDPIDAEAYRVYYSEIGEDNAEKIFKKVAKQYLYKQEVRDQADIFSKMQPANAARVLETMTGDLDLIADILNSMQNSKKSAILDQMDSLVVAQIETKLTR